MPRSPCLRYYYWLTADAFACLPLFAWLFFITPDAADHCFSLRRQRPPLPQIFFVTLMPFRGRRRRAIFSPFFRYATITLYAADAALPDIALLLCHDISHAAFHWLPCRDMLAFQIILSIFIAIFASC